MTSPSARTTFVLAIALLLPSVAAVWLMLKPGLANGSTYAVFAALIVAIAAISINTWQNAQAVTSTSHVIHDAEVATPATARPTAPRTSL